MIPVEPWVAVAVILFIQPLIGLLWAYALYRAAVAATVNTVSSAVDSRVDHAVQRLQGEK
jgi:hypothetical protein